MDIRCCKPTLRTLLIALPWLTIHSTSYAQEPTLPIRPIGPALATAAEHFDVDNSPLQNTPNVRVLHDGRVLVNDHTTHRILLFDSTLAHATVVADTSAATERAYGSGLVSLIPFSEDSSLIADELTGALLVLDPVGKIARVMRIPGSRGGFTGPLLPGNPNSKPTEVPLGFDQAGHIVFLTPLRPFLALLDQDFVGDTLMFGPDSIPLLRRDLRTQRIDTVAMLEAPRMRQAVTRRDGRGSGRSAFNPLPAGDDWTLLNDGTIAIVRARDYHIDWIQPSGRVSPSARVPARWIRLTDSMKVATIDSLRRQGFGHGDEPSGSLQRPLVAPSDLPDFRPVFLSGFAIGDAQGNVWVRERPEPLSSDPVYDVVDRGGKLIDRIRLPDNVKLVGFGPNTAYVMRRSGNTMELAKLRWH